MSFIFISHSSQDNAVATQIRTRLAEWGHRSVFLDFDPADRDSCWTRLGEGAL